MTASPPFVYHSSIARALARRTNPKRLSLRARSTPGRLRHVKSRVAIGLQRTR
jgi:hypothetical protein